MNSCTANVRSYLEDAFNASNAESCCGSDAIVRGEAKQCGMTEFSGSYVPMECQQGMLGGSEYYRAHRESELARMAPDVLARSVRSSWDDGYINMITPDKPAPVSLAGYDVFGPQSFATTTRNMTLDLRGEAAYAPNLIDELPAGASIASMAAMHAMNYSDCSSGCGCQSKPAGIQLPAAKMPVVAAAASPICLRASGCVDSIHAASDNGVLNQSCIDSCREQGCSTEADCARVCNGMFQRGDSVGNVHPMQFFAPQRVKPVTVLQPFHVAL